MDIYDKIASVLVWVKLISLLIIPVGLFLIIWGSVQYFKGRSKEVKKIGLVKLSLGLVVSILLLVITGLLTRAISFPN